MSFRANAGTRGFYGKVAAPMLAFVLRRLAHARERAEPQSLLVGLDRAHAILQRIDIDNAVRPHHVVVTSAEVSRVHDRSARGVDLRDERVSGAGECRLKCGDGRKIG